MTTEVCLLLHGMLLWVLFEDGDRRHVWWYDVGMFLNLSELSEYNVIMSDRNNGKIWLKL